MSEYRYHCYYCDNKWGGVYRVNDPECKKCGSEGDFYVKTHKVEHSGDAFGYELEEALHGEKQGQDVGRDTTRINPKRSGSDL